MKNLILVLFLGLFLFSCKTNSIYYNKKEFVTYQSNSQQYTMSAVRKLQASDAKFIDENYTEEEKKEFAKRFFYKEITFLNDTLFIIK